MMKKSQQQLSVLLYRNKIGKRKSPPEVTASRLTIRAGKWSPISRINFVLPRSVKIAQSSDHPRRCQKIVQKASRRGPASRPAGRPSAEIVTIEAHVNRCRGSRSEHHRSELWSREGREGEIRMPRKYREHNNQK